MKLVNTITRAVAFAMLFLMICLVNPAMAQIPVRDPHTPGYVAATELPDGTIPTANDYGNFIIGPTHAPAPESVVKEGVPQGTVSRFTIESKDSKIYPGIAKDR